MTLDEAAGLDFQRNDIAAVSDMPGGPVGTIGSPRFMLGDFSIEIMNYGDDYKTTPVADANWFSWGVKVSAYGKPPSLRAISGIMTAMRTALRFSSGMSMFSKWGIMA